jgi:hypothetical protein
MDTPWKLLSVQDFLSRYNQATADNSFAVANGTELQKIWQYRTVKDFFATCQWSITGEEPDTSAPFSLGLCVQSYFQYFQWNAPVKNLVAPQPKTPIDLPPSFDVQKFSDLF